ncbi:MAG: D-alanyl-D-alanine carboxypeptidase/D-alanyl-D-alanine-endopeptidase [Flavobacteriales bacterium]|nr:D-alanyl-D-alanine carboxypeptidase/D-alanyl-D-alanine-endopeptidase [Flavobacteriales bacterium]
MKSLFLSLLISFPLSILAQDRALNTVEVELQRLMQDPAFRHGQLAFVAVNLDNGKVIAEHNNYRAMIPASIQKIITTATSLDRFGPAYSFKTSIGYTGSIVEGTLEGDLIISGAGDPTLGSRFFSGEEDWNSIKTAISNAGITAVHGKVIVDASAYAKHTTPDAMSWEDMGNYFGATPSAFMWKDNMMEVALRSGQVGTDVVLADPWPTDGPFALEIDIQAAEGTKDDAWFFSAPGSDLIYGKGSIPAHRERFVVKISNPDPMHTFCQWLIDDLDLGTPEIQINHERIPIPNIQVLVALESPHLSDVIRVTNQESVNLFAEALNLANDQAEVYRSVDGGLEASKAFLQKHKIKAAGVRLLDGSGISPMNRMTAQTMVEVLSTMYRTDSYEFFRASLAVGGESGTMKWYFKSGAAKGNIRGKSGTMTGVRNYAGYVKNQHDEQIAFCLMMNDYDEARRSEVMHKFETLIEAVIQD